MGLPGWIDCYPLVGQGLSPETPKELVVDFFKDPRNTDIKNELIRGARAMITLANIQQHRINQFNKSNPPRRLKNLGEHVGRISYFQYWGEQSIHGVDCWGDSGFIKSFLRDNPACRIQNKYPVTITV